MRESSGADGTRTRGLLAASQTLSQLSYGPAPAKCSVETELLSETTRAAWSFGKRSASSPW